MSIVVKVYYNYGKRYRNPDQTFGSVREARQWRRDQPLHITTGEVTVDGVAINPPDLWMGGESCPSCPSIPNG